MDLSLSLNGPLRGTLSLPGDKSLSHRAALFAALAEGTSEIDHFLDAGVTRALLNALSALGVSWRLDGEHLSVSGVGLRGLRESSSPVFCGNSATTFRLLAGAIAAAGIPCILDGSEGLRKRPMDRIIEPLREMGVPVSSPDGHAPLVFARRTAGTPLVPLAYTLPVASAQVKSCLILAALAASGENVLSEPGPSRDHTERMLGAMGAKIVVPSAGKVRVVPLSAPLSPLHVALPGDISSAAFLLAAAALAPGSSVLLRDIGVNPTRTGILDAFRAMGADIELLHPREVCGEPVADIRLAFRPLHGIEVGGDLVVRMIDEFPVFAAVACAADGVTTVRDAKELRYKETDRISVLCAELRGLGVCVEEFPDGFRMKGKSCSGGTADAHGDHRLAMSLALSGLAAPRPVTVSHAEILNESFPTFLPLFVQLGGRACPSA